VKTFKYKNATINVRGEVDKEKLRNATIQFLTKSYRYKLMRGRKHDKG
jgi:hypothetical protein